MLEVIQDNFVLHCDGCGRLVYTGLPATKSGEASKALIEYAEQHDWTLSDVTHCGMCTANRRNDPAVLLPGGRMVLRSETEGRADSEDDDD